jgi:hypothetical protein
MDECGIIDVPMKVVCMMLVTAFIYYNTIERKHSSY